MHINSILICMSTFLLRMDATYKVKITSLFVTPNILQHEFQNSIPIMVLTILAPHLTPIYHLQFYSSCIHREFNSYLFLDSMLTRALTIPTPHRILGYNL